MLSATTNAAKSAQNCQKLPKSAQKQFSWGTLKYHQKLRLWCFSFKKNYMCRKSTKAYAYHLDFHYKNFSNAFFIVKKWPLYVNFIISLCAKWCFFQGSICLVGMRFCWHVPNSPTNKNLKSLELYLLQKMVFLASKKLLYPLSTWEFFIFFNFDHYALANGKEWVCMIW
jgi:hypothetical protein